MQMFGDKSRRFFITANPSEGTHDEYFETELWSKNFK